MTIRTAVDDMTTSAVKLPTSWILVVRDMYPILKMAPLVIAIVLKSSLLTVLVVNATERVSVVALVYTSLKRDQGTNIIHAGRSDSIQLSLVRAYDAD